MKMIMSRDTMFRRIPKTQLVGNARESGRSGQHDVLYDRSQLNDGVPDSLRLALHCLGHA